MNIRTALLALAIAVMQIGTGPPGLGRQACAAGRETDRGHILRFGVHVSGIGNLDPHLAAASQDRAVADMVFNGLLRYEPGNAPKIEPDLATALPVFKLVGGRQIWTVTLRKGVLFHPGPQTDAYELTADDVVYSLHKSADKDRCAYAGEYSGMRIEKKDRYTVDIILDTPLSAVLFLPKLTNYAGGFIVSKKAVETMGYDQFKKHPVGTGPFMFTQYRPGEPFLLAANPNYFRGRPRLDGVEMHFVPDIATRENALRSGGLDVIMSHGEKGWAQKMEKTPGIVVDSHGVGEVAAIYFNTAMKPFDDVRVRRAVAYALDRERFADTTSRRIVGRTFSFVPPEFLPGGLTPDEVKKLGLAYETNLAHAKQLMAEAGYLGGFDLELVTSEKRIYRRYYETLCSQLERIGITCRTTVMTHAAMHRHIRQHPMRLVIYVAWRPNADVFLSRFFHSDSIVVTGANPDTNFSHYDKIDNLIEAARVQLDPGKQIVLWKQAQIRILNDMAAYPIMYTNQGYARRTTVNYGHPLISTMALYPQFTEKTTIDRGTACGKNDGAIPPRPGTNTMGMRCQGTGSPFPSWALRWVVMTNAVTLRR